MALEEAVITHYELGDLLDRILNGLSDSGVDLDNIQPRDLAPVEEFHIGGRAATEYLVESLGIGRRDHVLDVGCGIGGTARYLTSHLGCRVTGIDLTPEFIATAKELTDRVGLSEKLHFEVASALAMPFRDGRFDAAVTLHVGMNIPHRASLYAEIARVMKPGGVFGVYDVMETGKGTLDFPVPWAQSLEMSHLETVEATVDLLADAGFRVESVEERREFALEFFERGLAAMAKGPAPLGVHLNMGDTAREKLGNMLQGVRKGLIAPVQMRATSG